MLLFRCSWKQLMAFHNFPIKFSNKISHSWRLLGLNLERAAEEAKRAKVKKSKVQREKEMEEMI